MNKKPTEAELKAMTVNERLYVMGLLEEWDVAAKAKDREKMINILSRCAMTKEEYEGTISAVLNNPAKYGF